MSSENNNTYDVMDGGGAISVDHAKNSKKTLGRLIKALAPQKWLMMIAFLFAIFGVLLNLWAPNIFADAINIIFEGVELSFTEGAAIAIDFRRLAESILLLIGVYILSSVFSYYQEYAMASVSQKLVLSLREQISEKLTKVPLKFYDTNQKGEVLSRVTNDLERVNEILRDAIMRLFTSAITIVGSVILMIRIDRTLTLIGVGAIVIGLVITMLVGIKSNEIFTDRQRSVGIFNTKIEEYFSGQVEIKAFNLEKEVIGQTKNSIDQLYQDDKKAQFIMFAIMPIIRLFNQIGYVVIAGLGASFVIRGRISVGQILSFFQYIQMSQEPLTEASYLFNSLQSAIASAERVFEIIDEEEMEEDTQINRRIKAPKGNISFENVQFGYGKELLMDGVDFEVKAGQKVAIVGPTGAGKTTMINLLMRFYETNAGAIKVDGVDVKKMSRHYLRSLFGMVLQDSWMFEGTVSENIAYGRHRASKSEIVNAARMARADHFIRTLPNGYDTVMNDENASLSQGEKQLLCIARAILTNPPMLLLDEATSSIDTRTELEIQKAMDNLMKGKTSFVIAHRLSTIKNADVILVMKEGNVVEVGDHKTLLQKGGMYSEIYNSQFAS
ncbi:ABC transporter ATP-binding protein [Enterococcus sp. DIV1298c]|uniref:ABC transporter ATP-binding protein n=1 Tax=Enterococcus sp. DIV1298c TaxID=2815328 RepID=UPI001A91EFCC|nr:ABC transporter ATP-binding protein [Enterococcus sp. DIV1298c]MBO0462716.1 ABC transporter ATP-binding protein [Enterococcus sp. DIV1298c]